MSHSLHVPDRTIVKALRRIDRGLSVHWCGDCFGVYYGLFTESPEHEVTTLARELARDYRNGGYEVAYQQCLFAAVRLVQERKLQCYVTEPDGSYRPLDDRIVEKFRRMDWYRRHYDAADFIRVMNAQDDKLRDARQRGEDTVWDSIKRDRVFHRMLGDVIAGVKPVRSVNVPAGMPLG